jgi:hypothetical protein
LFEARGGRLAIVGDATASTFANAAATSITHVIDSARAAASCPCTLVSHDA